MAETVSDGFFELAFNGDETQIFATIYPPRGGGKAVTRDEIITRLKEIGVMFGLRESEIGRAAAHAAKATNPISRVLVAQGVLPVEGTEARVYWKVDHAAAMLPLPQSPCGAPDFDSVPSARLVKAGQVIATVKPAMPGSTGKTLKPPYRTVPATAPRDVLYAAESGVSYLADRQQFVADVDGILEIKGDSIRVLSLEWVEGNLQNTRREFNSGVVIQGDVTASTVRAAGPIIIRGTVAGCTIRAKGDVVLNRCARSKIVANGDIFVLGKLLHSQAITPSRAVVADGALLAGGAVYATLGIRATEVGTADGTATLLAAAVDQYTPFRQQEVETEIAQHEENIQKIAQALRPLSATVQEGALEQKRHLVQTLSTQRRSIEERVRELHHEKRNLLLASKTRVDAQICIAGTIYRGATVQLDGASVTLEETRRAVRFALDSFRESVLAGPFVEALAA